jgi:hypothetical protein
MPAVFRTVMKRFNLSPGDFPDLADFQMKLADQDFTKFHNLRQKLIDDAETVLSQDFPRLLEALPRLEAAAAAASAASAGTSSIPPIPQTTYGSVTYAAASVDPDWNNGKEDNPFGSDEEWSLIEFAKRYQPAFQAASKDGFLAGSSAITVLSASGTSKANLRKIWDLADIDKDGQLDFNEFVVAMYLVDSVKAGQPVPVQLDYEMIPPEKRR